MCDFTVPPVTLFCYLHIGTPYLAAVHTCVTSQSQVLWTRLFAAFFLWREEWLSFVQVALMSPCAGPSGYSSVCGSVGTDTGLQDQCTTTPTTRNLSGSFTGSSPELL